VIPIAFAGRQNICLVKSRKDRKIERRLHIGHLLKMVLQDAQTRLIFKAQAVVQSEIRHYVPTPDDLNWPDILLVRTQF